MSMVDRKHVKGSNKVSRAGVICQRMRSVNFLKKSRTFVLYIVLVDGHFELCFYELKSNRDPPTLQCWVPAKCSKYTESLQAQKPGDLKNIRRHTNTHFDTRNETHLFSIYANDTVY